MLFLLLSFGFCKYFALIYFLSRGNVIAEHKLYLTLALFIPVGCYGLYKKSFLVRFL